MKEGWGCGQNPPFYILGLQKTQNGTQLPDNITKHIDDGIWELRPGNNRVFYFYFQDDCFVLLHYFRKKSQKTPQREIDRAKAERADYLNRKGIKSEYLE